MNKMKVVFLTGMLNHHQRAFSESMLELCEYHLIATEDTAGVGYQKPMDADYVVHWYKDEEKDLAKNLIREADVAIFGGCPLELVDLRMKENKLSFLYSERFFKKGTWRRFIPKTRKAIQNKIGKYKDKNMYVLCASAYLPYDLSFFGFPTEKCFKWGYFPEIKQYDDIDSIVENKTHTSILWAGRFIDWKHPEKAIKVAKHLKKNGYDFSLKMAGDGPMKARIEKMIIKHNLSENVKLLGSMKPEELRLEMERAGIYLFTSNRKEGWGAVINEAMNSACAVIADCSAGATPFMVEDNVTGFLYGNGNAKELYSKVKYLLDHPNKEKEMCKKAYQSIILNWNAKVAAERLVALSNAIINGESTDLYKEGPCSKARILKDNWR